jgi:sodium/potassium-transporting ATPase subunit alpha
MNVSEIQVVRNGKVQKCPLTQIVKGDVVKICLGDKIPADCRIFVSNGLKVDNAPLMGELLPVKIGPEPAEKGMKDTMEALNLTFYTTLCKEGEGTGVVFRIGMDTFMGKIANLASSADQRETTLKIEIDKFVHLIAWISVIVELIFFCLGFIVGYPPITNFIFAIGMIVANVPEGLGYTVTALLSITAQKMYKRKVFIKNLQSVETLGSITCICSDKTGTLTQNKMTVVHLWYPQHICNDRVISIPFNSKLKFACFLRRTKVENSG